MQITSLRALLVQRLAVQHQATFVFFPHAGGSPLSVGALAAALPSTVGVIAVNLAHGGAAVCPPRRVGDAVEMVVQGFQDLAAQGGMHTASRIVLVGNSYGALLAYETAWSLLRIGVCAERLIVSGFRSPARASTEAPLHRLAPEQLRAELAARFGGQSSVTVEDDDFAQQALRADLEACDTYRHAHQERLCTPIDVLHLLEDSSVSPRDLAAWSMLSSAATTIRQLNAGHFPWATHPDAVARLLLERVDANTGCVVGQVESVALAVHSLRG